MPHMGMSMHQAQRLEQRLEMRQMLAPAELGVAPFRTEGEELQISEYDILKKLLSLIDKGEFFDPTHFTLETNRAIFTNPASKIRKVSRQPDIINETL